MRALAETENVRKRMKKQVDETKVFGIQGFCKDLLEVADILNQAMDSVPRDELDKNVHLKSLFEGLTMTNKQMVKVFGKHGLTKIEPRVGDKFDPFCHEALFQVPVQGDNKPGCIADVQKSGYQLHDRTVRPAIVGVFKS
jgi:molecular chaperone GrpE